MSRIRPRHRRAADHEQAVTAALALRVHSIVGELHDITLEAIEHTICEALYQVAHDIRSGHRTELEHIGTIQLINYGDDACLHYTPDHSLYHQPQEERTTHG